MGNIYHVWKTWYCEDDSFQLNDLLIQLRPFPTSTKFFREFDKLI